MRVFMFLLLGSLCLSTSTTADESIKVMAYNLRYASNSKPNAWPDRLPVMGELINKTNPDIIGTQEGKFYQLKELNKKIPQYTWFGTGRDGGSRGEFMAIFYKKDRFEILDYDHFWLSDTPNVIASTTWGHSNRRMVTWIRFLDQKTKKQFYFLNTHFDHRVQTAREKAALLVNKKVTALETKLPILLAGDFNASAGMNKVYDIFVKEGGFTDTLLSAKKKINADWNTINGFRPTRKGKRRIDWVLAKGPVSAIEAEIVLYDNSKQYPSDHQPVSAVITLE
ncbi:MAG: endonuclease/exonuclease/phosphatase family protein [Verrucomicrobiota bacterium]|nr:endonuclease/exonuclease/phosphatase family protein [Verrucomicrobiota bacterium]